MVAAHRAVWDTPLHSAHISHDSSILSRHHSPSLSIVDEFNSISTKCLLKDVTLCKMILYTRLPGSFETVPSDYVIKCVKLRTH